MQSLILIHQLLCNLRSIRTANYKRVWRILWWTKISYKGMILNFLFWTKFYARKKCKWYIKPMASVFHQKHYYQGIGMSWKIWSLINFFNGWQIVEDLIVYRRLQWMESRGRSDLLSTSSMDGKSWKIWSSLSVFNWWKRRQS